MDVPEGAETVLSASRFGWCTTGQHTTCPKAYRPFYYEKKGRKEFVKYHETWRLCPCKCHGNVKADTKAKKSRRKR